MEKANRDLEIKDAVPLRPSTLKWDNGINELIYEKHSKQYQERNKLPINVSHEQ